MLYELGGGGGEKTIIKFTRGYKNLIILNTFSIIHNILIVWW